MKRRFPAVLAKRSAQRGIVGMVALMFIIIVVFFAMSQASTITASNISDSQRQIDSVEALFLAESGIEHIGYRFVTSGSPAVCTDAQMGVGEADVTVGRGAFRVLATFTTDWDGDTLPATMCRVRVQGEITASKVKRTIETLVATEDDFISISSMNPNFNTSPYDNTRVDDGITPPDNWTLTGGTQGLAYIAWDQNGGNSDNNITCKTDATLVCNRAAFARKTTAGSGTASSGGAFTVPLATPIMIYAPKTLRLTFDFRVWTRGNSDQEMQFSPRLIFTSGALTPVGKGGGACDPNGTNGICESGPTYTATQPRQSNGQAPSGCGYTDTPGFESGTGGPNVASSGPACPDPPVGTVGYVTGSLDYNLPGSGQVQLTSISFSNTDGSGALRGKDGQITWLWIDNLRLTVPSLSGGGPSKMWREVAAP